MVESKYAIFTFRPLNLPINEILSIIPTITNENIFTVLHYLLDYDDSVIQATCKIGSIIYTSYFVRWVVS